MLYRKEMLSMYDHDDEPRLLRGLFFALLFEGLSVVVVVGLIKILIALTFNLFS